MGRWGLFLLPICLSAYLPALVACRRQAPLKPYTAYVVNHQSATLAAVNLANFQVIASLPVSPQPERVLERPHARQLYVVSATGKISVAAYPHLHLLTTLEVGKSAKDLAFSPEGRAAYVLDPADHEVVFLDCGGAAGNPTEESPPQVTSRLHLEGTLADLVLSADGKTLVASSASPDLLTFISTETHHPLGTVEVGQSPGPMVVLPDNSKVFVADTGEE
jgi:DNA-binding beta-propeller fold protein YncE